MEPSVTVSSCIPCADSVCVSFTGALDEAFDTSVPVQAAVEATTCGHAVAETLRFGATVGRSVEAFYLSAPTVTPVTAGSWVGSVRAGSGVNCDQISLCPHGAGTHTECVGHITVRQK